MNLKKMLYVTLITVIVNGNVMACGLSVPKDHQDIYSNNYYHKLQYYDKPLGLPYLENLYNSKYLKTISNKNCNVFNNKKSRNGKINYYNNITNNSTAMNTTYNNSNNESFYHLTVDKVTNTSYNISNIPTQNASNNTTINSALNNTVSYNSGYGHYNLPSNNKYNYLTQAIKAIKQYNNNGDKLNKTIYSINIDLKKGYQSNLNNNISDNQNISSIAGRIKHKNKIIEKRITITPKIVSDNRDIINKKNNQKVVYEKYEYNKGHPIENTIQLNPSNITNNITNKNNKQNIVYEKLEYPIKHKTIKNNSISTQNANQTTNSVKICKTQSNTGRLNYARPINIHKQGITYNNINITRNDNHVNIYSYNVITKNINNNIFLNKLNNNILPNKYTNNLNNPIITTQQNNNFVYKKKKIDRYSINMRSGYDNSEFKYNKNNINNKYLSKNINKYYSKKIFNINDVINNIKLYNNKSIDKENNIMNICYIGQNQIPGNIFLEQINNGLRI